MLDERPNEAVDLIAPLEPPVAVPEPTIALPAQPARTTATRPHIALDENSPEAPPLTSFEVSSTFEPRMFD
jgi:hypothetical protein